jgi:transposase-like protein
LTPMRSIMKENQRQKRRGRYSLEFRARTLELLRTSGKNRAQVSRDLGVPSCTLKWWQDRQGEMDVAKTRKPATPATRLEELEAENRRLLKENRVLLMERDILKKGGHVVREGKRMKFAFIATHRETWPVVLLCKCFGVTRQGFHEYLHAPKTKRELAAEDLDPKVRKLFDDHRGRYGAPRITQTLKQEQLLRRWQT